MAILYVAVLIVAPLGLCAAHLAGTLSHPPDPPAGESAEVR